MIKAIETEYKGYRFRSRLEARWAVFFDTLGIAWEYEKEGYDLGNGRWYLPDFWLPQVNMWAEIKPTEFTLEESARAFGLAQGTGHPVLMQVGLPENKGYEAAHPMPAGSRKWTQDEWEEFNAPIDYHLTMYHDYPITEGRFYSCDLSAKFDDTEKACAAARSARFEHGEHGTR